MSGNLLPAVPKPPKALNNANKFFIGVSVSFFFICLVGYSCYTIIGGEREKNLPIPDVLAGGELVSIDGMFYMAGPFGPTTKTFEKVGRELIPIDQHRDYERLAFREKFTVVPIGTHFKIIGYINNANYGLAAFDSGTDGVNYLILEDENNIKSLLAQVYFKDFSFSEKNYHFLFSKNGARIGFLDYDYGTGQIKIHE